MQGKARQLNSRHSKAIQINQGKAKQGKAMKEKLRQCNVI
jgi:hypothetical protein